MSKKVAGKAMTFFSPRWWALKPSLTAGDTPRKMERVMRSTRLHSTRSFKQQMLSALTQNHAFCEKESNPPPPPPDIIRREGTI